MRANGTYERLVWNDRRGEYVRCAEAWETLARAATTTDDGGAFREFRGRFRLYLETDYAFLMDFVDVIARAFASTSKYGVKRRLGEFLGAIVVGEGEIFRKSLRALWAVSPETAAEQHQQLPHQQAQPMCLGNNNACTGRSEQGAAPGRSEKSHFLSEPKG